MNKKIAFVWIFAGVVAAGLLVLAAAFIVRALITGNAVVTVVTLFAIIAGAIMAGLGLIALLICLLLLLFSKGGDNKDVQNKSEPQSADNAE
ncbi:MAG: hypothetical protein ACI4MQ_04280 [Candidatus Coproplasma sp.]